MQQPFNALGVFCEEQRQAGKIQEKIQGQKAGKVKHHNMEGADGKHSPCIITKTRHVKLRGGKQNILAHKNKLNQIARECRQYI